MSSNNNNNSRDNDDKSIPYAQPFPWKSPSLEEEQRNSARCLRKRKFVGSGLAQLQEVSSSKSKILTKTAKTILANLMQQHGGMELLPSKNEDNIVPTSLDSTSKEINTKDPKPSITKVQKRGEPKHGTSEEEVLRNAAEGNYSLFKTILRVIEKETGKAVVHTKVFLSKACLVVRPSQIPGQMDAKDMVLAALHFLSTTYKPKSKELLELPLIRPAQVYSDLEKRNYLKAGSWKLEDIEKKLLKMEELFLASPSHWKWMKRETFCPRLTWEEESLFFQKGSVPTGAEPKRKGDVRRRPRKTPASATASPALSTIRTETPTPSFLAEASVDGSVEDDDDDDDEPVVEATILDDDQYEDED